jgi:hypothetical protein
MRNVKNPVLALIAPFAFMAPALTGETSRATSATPGAARYTPDKKKSDDHVESDDPGKSNGQPKDDNKHQDGTPQDNKPQDDSKPQDDNPTGAGDQAPPAAPEPAAGSAVVVGPASGSVRVRLPGSDTFVDLGEGRAVPVGATVDATQGKVSLTSTSGAGVQTGEFWGATFEVRQGTAPDATTDLVMRGGNFAKCPALKHRRGIRASAARRRKSRIIRTLWGSDHGGSFRTQGRSSVATVRGTAWVTQDRCDGTLTRVTSGAVSVWNRVSKRAVLVHAGRQYLAPLRHAR